MIKVEPCKGCGGVLLVDDFMGVRVRCNPTPLDAQTAGQALVGGQSLYRVLYQGGRPDTFGSASPPVLGALRAGRSPGLTVVAQHRCTIAATKKPDSGPQTAWGPAGQENPQGPPPKASQPLPAARSTPSWEPSPHAPAKNAANQASRISIKGPRCSGCGEPCEDGTYSAIELGEVVIWAAHVEDCP